MARERSVSRAARVLGAAVLALLWMFGCGAQGRDPTGGETHFLRRCTPQAEACGSELACLDGACTRACDGDSQCTALGASCVATATAELAVCDVPCGSDPECASVSARHRCEAGRCRVPDSSQEPGSEPSNTPQLPEGLGGAGGAPAATCALSDRASGVVVLGDTFFATSPPFVDALESRAREAGALAGDRNFRSQARLFSNALALGGRGIEDEYAAALAESPVHTVIVSGGGADALVGSCDDPSDPCPLLTDAAQAASDLLARFAADGVEHVLYVFYPDPLSSPLKERIDALRPLLRSACDASPAPCRFVDLRSAFEGRYGELIQTDGMNPTPAGTEVVAQVVWSAFEPLCAGP